MSGFFLIALMFVGLNTFAQGGDNFRPYQGNHGQDMLELTDEQKEKVEEIKLEFAESMIEIQNH